MEFGGIIAFIISQHGDVKSVGARAHIAWSVFPISILIWVRRERALMSISRLISDRDFSSQISSPTSNIQSSIGCKVLKD